MAAHRKQNNKNDLEVKNEEVVDHTKALIVSNFAQYGQPAPEDKNWRK